jgi:hypothetical protein
MGTGSRRKVLSEYFVIDDVTEVRTGAGQTALVVEMRDGGLGASHIAIVDPTRGEVFSKSRAKLLKYDTDVLVLGYYREEDWERMARGDEISPYETERYNLDSLLQRPVIINIGRTP